MTLPNFLVIGAPCAGFSAVAKLLSMHPDICMASEEKPNFFSVDGTYSRGQQWYEDLFGHWKGQPAVGDASSTYSRTGMFPNTGPRIVRHLPEARIVYLLRQPMDRLEAGYLRFIEELPAGVDKPPISAVVQKIKHLIGSSLYFTHLTYYKQHIPQERTCVVFYEDLIAKPAEEFGRVLKFIGVPRERAMEVEEERVRGLLQAEREREQEQRNRHPITWNTDVRKSILTLLRTDADHTLAAWGKPKNFWALI